MFATATAEYPIDRMWGSNTQFIPVAPRGKTECETVAVARAKLVQSQGDKLNEVFSASRNYFVSTSSITNTSSTTNTSSIANTIWWRNSDELITQASLAQGKLSLISWLLDSRAWGDHADRLKSETKALMSLERGWDGEDGEAIDARSVDYACAFIDYLGERAKDFEPFADPNGTVGLEAHIGEKAAYLSFYNNGLMAYVFRVGDAISRGNNARPEMVRRVMNAVL